MSNLSLKPDLTDTLGPFNTLVFLVIMRSDMTLRQALEAVEAVERRKYTENVSIEHLLNDLPFTPGSMYRQMAAQWLEHL